MEKKQVQKLKLESKKASREENKKQEKLRQYVLLFLKQQKRYKTTQRQWEDAKKAFYEAMEEAGVVEQVFPVLLNGQEQDVKCAGGTKVLRIQKKRIVWYPDKLEKRLKKSLRNKVIQKRYFINDIDGLIEYLKEHDVDPKQFKKYLDVEKEVDNVAIDNLHNTGEISKKDIEGCYQVIKDKPYFKVSEVKED